MKEHIMTHYTMYKCNLLPCRKHIATHSYISVDFIVTKLKDYN